MAKKPINQLVKDVQDALNSFADKQEFESLEQARAAILELEGYAGDVKATSLSNFFTHVGEAAVAAQKVLDEESRHYNNSLPDQNLEQSTSFRLPKVSAEFNFGMTSGSGSNFNALVFGSSKSKKQQENQKVSFEIVATPLPPEARQQAGGSRLAIPLLTNLAKREEIFALLEDVTPRALPADSPVNPHGDLTAKKGRDNVLMVVSPKTETVLLLFKSGGIWRLWQLHTGEDEPKLDEDAKSKEAIWKNALSPYLEEILLDQLAIITAQRAAGA